MAFAAANLVRQAVIIVTTAEIPQAMRVASWVATALVVIIAINSIAVALRRGDAAPLGKASTLAPIWPLRRRDERGHESDGSPPNPDRTDNPTQPIGRSTTGPSKEKTVMNQQLHEQPTTSAKWAPWWVYLAVIVGANYLRRAVVADGSVPAVRVVVALATSAALFTIITVVYRANVRHDGSHRGR